MAVTKPAEVGAAAAPDAPSEPGVAPSKERGVPEADGTTGALRATAIAASPPGPEAAFRAPVGVEAALAGLGPTGVAATASRGGVRPRRAVAVPENLIPGPLIGVAPPERAPPSSVTVVETVLGRAKMSAPVSTHAARST